MSLMVCGPLAIRQADSVFMKKGEVALGHCHNFGHPTFVRSGAFDINLLRVTKLNVDGNPIDAEIEETIYLEAEDEINFAYISAGRWHSLIAKKDRSRYQCIYPHRNPTSLTIGQPGIHRADEEWTKTDEKGDLWVRVDRNIVTDATGWQPAYA